MKTTPEHIEAAKAELRKLLENKTLLLDVKSVARSGMSRVLAAKVVSGDQGKLRDIGGYICSVLNYTRIDGWSYNGFRVHGCGMDMLFHTAECLSYALYGEPGKIRHQQI